MNTIQFLHIENSAWIGIYLNGKKISDGYFNLEEAKEAEEAIAKFGGLVGIKVYHVSMSQDWFMFLGGRLPDYIGSTEGVDITGDQAPVMVNYYC